MLELKTPEPINNLNQFKSSNNKKVQNLMLGSKTQVKNKLTDGWRNVAFIVTIPFFLALFSFSILTAIVEFALCMLMFSLIVTIILWYTGKYQKGTSFFEAFKYTSIGGISTFIALSKATWLFYKKFKNK